MTNPAGTWSDVQVAGHTCSVYEPAAAHPQGFAAIYLHGVHVNRLNDQEAFTRQFARHGLRVICPRTMRSWWSDRICPEFDVKRSAERYVLHDVMPFVAEHWSARPPQVGIFGTSMGGQGALRFAFRHPRTFPVAAAISPAIDFHLRIREGDELLTQMYGTEETARQDTATLHVHPLNWPRNIWFCCDPIDLRWHESAERLRMKLSALGIPHVCDLETSGGGHSFEYYGRMAEAAVDFLVERLEAERLRVV